MRISGVATVTRGLDIRAQIDTENVKGLLLINGGASIALLAFLPTVLSSEKFFGLAEYVLLSVACYQVGLLAAVVHNRLRRVCSLIYESAFRRGPGASPEQCKVYRWSFREPCVCCWSNGFMWLSVISFVLGGSVVIYGGFQVIGDAI